MHERGDDDRENRGEYDTLRHHRGVLKSLEDKDLSTINEEVPQTHPPVSSPTGLGLPERDHHPARGALLALGTAIPWAPA
ncbi:hypothetical protein GCM10023317_34520 [Actinopolymorpha pittospori]